jgi:predicted nucleic-acid-binding protein
VKITADTNILLRSALRDDPRQSRLAAKALEEAELVAIPLPVLCEFVWVLQRGYKRPAAQVAHAIRLLLETANVTLDRTAAEAGLRILEEGGDFADGVIAHQGAWLGADEFVSFDKDAVKRLKAQGVNATLLA